MSIETGQSFPQSNRLKKADGTIAVVWEGRLHNWDGPALIPEGNEKKAEYYIYGIKYSKADWQERRRQREG